jgi:Outer membrane lipoprotein-sorting protein
MKTLHRLITLATAAIFVSSAAAAESASPAMSANDLAARLSDLQQDGSSYVRLRLDVQQPGGAKIALQLQIKQRRTRAGTDVVYQVLWPKERKGEAVLLRKAANKPATGALLVLPDTIRPLDASQMKDPLFGSDLSYADVLENFFAWEHQAIVGTEVVERVNCQILESKPGKGQQSPYASVRSWVDARRFLPLRVEKYLASGQLARRIDTTKVATDDNRRPIPANLSVRSRKDSLSELDGSRIKRDVNYGDHEFTPEGLKKMAVPRSTSE